LGEREDRLFATVFLGYGLVALLFPSSRSIEGILLLFPLWILLVSIDILIDNLRKPPTRAADSAPEP
jgi:hypothetical protein